MFDLVACGPDAQAVLSTTEERFVWVDEQVIPYDTITMAQLATRCQLSLVSSGLRYEWDPA